jgi:hypothetical protein
MYAASFFGFSLGKILFYPQSTTTAKPFDFIVPDGSESFHSLSSSADQTTTTTTERVDKLPMDCASNVARVAVAGSCSGFFTAPFLCPSERVKCLMQVDDSDLSVYFLSLSVLVLVLVSSILFVFIYFSFWIEY